GKCALLCPACPQPGKNRPTDFHWRNTTPEKRFLYALFLAIDANFRMKWKDLSTEADDPDLGDGRAFFVRFEDHMAHLRKNWDMEQEVRNFMEYSQVYCSISFKSTWGIGTVDCARHNMKRPNGVSNLQKGVRYINMDYMVWTSLGRYETLVQLFVSYNIVCQWHINVWQRLAKYNPTIQQRCGQLYFVWLIPKFHLPAHIEACNIHESCLAKLEPLKFTIFYKCSTVEAVITHSPRWMVKPMGYCSV
ncbi:hypothetical protein B0H13DRAFT_1608416, partial [Mycena leptocephala]